MLLGEFLDIGDLPQYLLLGRAAHDLPLIDTGLQGQCVVDVAVEEIGYGTEVTEGQGVQRISGFQASRKGIPLRVR